MLGIVIGIIAIAIGCVLIIKTGWFLEFFGRVAWAEQHLGTEGGSRIFYKLVGITFIVLGFMFMTGFAQALIMKLFTFKGAGM